MRTVWRDIQGSSLVRKDEISLWKWLPLTSIPFPRSNHFTARGMFSLGDEVSLVLGGGLVDSSVFLDVFYVLGALGGMKKPLRGHDNSRARKSRGDTPSRRPLSIPLLHLK